MLTCHHSRWAAKPTNPAFSTVVNATCHGYEEDSVLHEECRAGGRGCYRALLLAVLLTHMTAIARSWNMNMCGMTLLFIINPSPTVGNRENAFPRLRRSSLEHLHQLLWLITLGAGNYCRNCAGGNCICTLSWLKTQIVPTKTARVPALGQVLENMQELSIQWFFAVP